MIKSFGGSKKCSAEIEVSIILLNLHYFSARASLTSEELEVKGIFFNVVKNDYFFKKFEKFIKNH